MLARVDGSGEALLREQMGDVHVDKLLRVVITPPSVTSVRVNTLVTSLDDACRSLALAMPSHKPTRALPPLHNEALLWTCHATTTTTTTSASSALPEVVITVQAGEAVLRGADLFAVGVLAMPPLLAVGALVQV